MIHRGLLSLLVAGLVSCASAPMRYYTLTPPGSAEGRAAVGSAGASRIEIASVRLPMQAERTELMVRRGDDELVLLENEHWASLPSSEIRDALLIGLRMALASADPTHAVSIVNLAVDVDRFDASPGQYAAIEATWRARLEQEGGQPILMTCRFKFSSPIGGSYPAMVAGYQRDVSALAGDIAAAVTASVLATRAQCPRDP